MGYQDKLGMPANSDDEIGALAKHYMLAADGDGLRQIECNIARALSDGQWDDLGKWHRVKLRLLRMQQEREATVRLARESRG